MEVMSTTSVISTAEKKGKKGKVAKKGRKKKGGKKGVKKVPSTQSFFQKLTSLGESEGHQKPEPPYPSPPPPPPPPVEYRDASKDNIPPIHNYLINLNSLTRNEEELLQLVLNKDAYFEKTIDEKVSALRNEILDLQSIQVEAAEQGRFFRNRRSCLRCTTKPNVFQLLFSYIRHMHRCQRCMFYVCRGCCYRQANGLYICSVCIRYREIYQLTGEWAHKGCTPISGSDLIRASLHEKSETPITFVPTSMDLFPPPQTPKEEPTKKKIKVKVSKKGKKKEKKSVKGKKGVATPGQARKGPNVKNTKAKKGVTSKTEGKMNIKEKENVNVSHLQLNISLSDLIKREDKGPQVASDLLAGDVKDDKEVSDKSIDDSEEYFDDDSSSKETDESSTIEDSMPAGASATYERKKCTQRQIDSKSFAKYSEEYKLSLVSYNLQIKNRKSNLKEDLSSQGDNPCSNYSSVTDWIENVNSKWNSFTKYDTNTASVSNFKCFKSNSMFDNKQDSRSSSIISRNASVSKVAVVHFDESAQSGQLSEMNSEEPSQISFTKTTDRSIVNLNRFEGTTDTSVTESRSKNEKHTHKKSDDLQYGTRHKKTQKVSNTETPTFSKAEKSQYAFTNLKKAAKKHNFRFEGGDNLEDLNKNSKITTPIFLIDKSESALESSPCKTEMDFYTKFKSTIDFSCGANDIDLYVKSERALDSSNYGKGKDSHIKFQNVSVSSPCRKVIDSYVKSEIVFDSSSCREKTDTNTKGNGALCSTSYKEKRGTNIDCESGFNSLHCNKKKDSSMKRNSSINDLSCNKKRDSFINEQSVLETVPVKKMKYSQGPESIDVSTYFRESYSCDQLLSDSSHTSSKECSRDKSNEDNKNTHKKYVLNDFSRHSLVRKMKYFMAYFLNFNTSASSALTGISQGTDRNKNKNFHLEVLQQSPVKSLRYFRKDMSSPNKKDKHRKRGSVVNDKHVGRKKDRKKDSRKDKKGDKKHHKKDKELSKEEKKKMAENEARKVMSKSLARNIASQPSSCVVKVANNLTQTESKMRHRKFLPCPFCKFYCDYGAEF